LLRARGTAGGTGLCLRELLLVGLHLLFLIGELLRRFHRVAEIARRTAVALLIE
jgi:hypothetical protein